MPNSTQQRQLLSNFINVKQNIIECFREDIYTFKTKDLVALWNRYVENERQGAYFMFHLDNKEDLIYLLKLENFNTNILSNLLDAVNTKPEINTKYFNYEDETSEYTSLSLCDIHEFILGSLKEIVTCILIYPFIEEYKTFYMYYINSQLK